VTTSITFDAVDVTTETKRQRQKLVILCNDASASKDSRTIQKIKNAN